MIGSTHGKWTVVSGPSSGSASHRKWLCRCECGTQKEVREYYLIHSKSTQCRKCAHLGHLSLGRLPKSDSIHAQHGISKELATRIYGIANAAIRRCTNLNCSTYHHYGGRGIKVYPDWISNIRLFVEYLLTLEGHDDGSLVIDRIDNDGNYEPGNLRFTTLSISHSNIRKKVNK